MEKNKKHILVVDDDEKIKELSEYANRKEEISIDLLEEKISFVNISNQWKSESCLLMPIVEKILSKGNYVGGEEIYKFEKKMKNIFLMSIYKDNFKNVYILLLEDLVKDKNQEMSRIFNFLGIDPLLDGNYSKVFNSSGVPRFKFLHNFLVNDNATKKILRKLIPNGILRKLSLVIRNLNPGDKLVINKNEKLVLKDIYREDINKLENLIKRDLNHWLKV